MRPASLPTIFVALPLASHRPIPASVRFVNIILDLFDKLVGLAGILSLACTRSGAGVVDDVNGGERDNPMTPWYLRFMASTRGRIISLLRRNAHTVEELAQGLNLTNNAVRAHLATLERDGLVEQRGVRRGGGSGKPAYAYDLAPAAEQMFPKPYAAVLAETLAALEERLSPAAVEALLRETGLRLARGYPAPPDGDLRARLEAAVAALNQLGALAEVDESGDCPEVRGYSCVLAALVPTHPEVCQLAESFVSEVAGVAMRERCERGASPRCRFQPAPTDTASVVD